MLPTFREEAAHRLQDRCSSRKSRALGGYPQKMGCTSSTALTIFSEKYILKAVIRPQTRMEIDLRVLFH